MQQLHQKWVSFAVEHFIDLTNVWLLEKVFSHKNPDHTVKITLQVCDLKIFLKDGEASDSQQSHGKTNLDRTCLETLPQLHNKPSQSRLVTSYILSILPSFSGKQPTAVEELQRNWNEEIVAVNFK